MNIVDKALNELKNYGTVTQKDYVRSLNSAPSLPPPEDYLAPFSYQQWISRNSPTPGTELAQYKQYIIDWNSNRYTQTELQEDIHNDYIALVKSLTLFYDKDDVRSFLKDIDFSNKLEVEQVIPYCVEKLKEICIYFSKKRESIKRKSVKSTLVGTNQALEKILYNFLLKSYTRYDQSVNITDTKVYNNLPELSSCKDFRIIINEFYDDTNYFDKDPLHTYIREIPDDAKAFYESKGYSEDMFEYLFNSGFASLCADNPLLYTLDQTLMSESPLSAYADFENRILTDYYQFKMSQKYIGTDQFNITGGYYDYQELQIDYPLQTGNNWFYFVSGENATEALEPVVQGIFLSATSIIEDGATGGSDYTKSDKIFVTQDGTIKGAWLRKTETPFETNTMECHLNVSEPSVFLYPYPGYGLSGEGLEWTGRELSNIDQTFKTLEKYEQDAILSAYYNTPIDYTLIGMPINNTSLIDDGATGDVQYKNADRISIRKARNDSDPNTVYHDDIEYSWLYRPLKTDIVVEKGKNYIHWPLRKFDDSTKLYPVLSSQCNSIALSSLTGVQIKGSKAGSDLYDSDIIYKLDSRYGSPVECAFLSGESISALKTGATGTKQNSISLKVEPGQTITFLWTHGNTPLDNVVFNVQHKADCPYLKTYHHSLRDESPINETPNVDYKNWQTCTCGAIIYSPCGHYGNTPDDNNGYTDIIYEDAQYPLPFTKKEWRDSANAPYSNSENFGWYQLTALSSEMIEPDVGWNKGRFINTQNNSFVLKQGVQYKFVRTGFGQSLDSLEDGTSPYLIINKPLTGVTEPVWKKAVSDVNGTWIKTASSSDMFLYPNDYIVYDRVDTNWYSLTASTNNLLTAPGYNPSIWSTFTRVPTGSYVEIMWPDKPNTQTKYIRSRLTKVAWSTNFSSSTSWTYLPANQPFRFLVDEIKTYNVVAVAYLPGNDCKDEEFYPAVKIYGITPTTYFEVTDVIITNPTIDFTINANLSGWNISTHTYDSTAAGGRPFWAVGSDEYDDITKSKGIDIYGGGIRFKNEYVPVFQPEPSQLVLNAGTYIEYYAKHPLIWTQDVDFIVNEIDNTWCDLVPNYTTVTNLSSKFEHLSSYLDLIASATDNPSDIYLSMDKNVFYPQKVNYWANHPFTWSQTYQRGETEEFTNYIPLSTNLMVESQYPWANIPNRHYPTIASVAQVENLYTSNDIGGYFVPKFIGMPTAYSKTFRTQFEVDTLQASGRGLSAVYRDTGLFSKDEGYTEVLQDTPVSIVDTDSYWMKSELSNSKNSGIIINPSYYQQFTSYTTDYEDKQMMTVGIRRTSDMQDPWTGPTNSTWDNPESYPPHFTKQYPLSAWITDNIISTSGVNIWKNDLYGNTYSVVLNSRRVTYYPGEYGWSIKAITDDNLYSIGETAKVSTEPPSGYISIPEGYEFQSWYNPLTDNYLQPGELFRVGYSDVTLSATYTTSS